MIIINSNKDQYIAPMQIHKSELNKNFKYTLMNLYDSWNDIPLSNIILLDNEYWELGIIIDHIIIFDI